MCVHVHCFSVLLGIGNILVSSGNDELSLSASAVISVERSQVRCVKVIVYTQAGHVRGLLLDPNHIETADWMNHCGRYNEDVQINGGRDTLG